jgi:hypothetical protein
MKDGVDGGEDGEDQKKRPKKIPKNSHASPPRKRSILVTDEGMKIKTT